MKIFRHRINVALAWLCLAVPLAAAEPAVTHHYAPVDAIFARHCLDCHAAKDPEGSLVLEDFTSLMKGGESGAAVVPGRSAESLLVQMIEGRFEKGGKKKIMPPGKRPKLEPDEIATIRSWIDAGAAAPLKGALLARPLVVPKITPKVAPRRAVNALAYAPGPKLLAVARYGEVELHAVESRTLVRTLAGHRGNVNALAFSADGSQLFAAAGEPGLFGEVRQWDVAAGTLVRTLEGHKDAIYALALSPDGRTLATGSYDQKIKLWNAGTGEEIRMLAGHNGCVFDLAFRPDGKLLASASGDRTVKLWDVASGERRDTLSQSLKELYAVVFSRDGQRLYAGGVDNRIRLWQISESAAETTNPLLDARFAHEGAILNLVLSPDGRTLLTGADDRTVKLWETGELKEQRVLEKQPDWARALTFAQDGKLVVVGRMDGTLGYYEVGEGAAASAPPAAPLKPELLRVEPRGVQRGVASTLKLSGKNLGPTTSLRLHHEQLQGEVLTTPAATSTEIWVRITSGAELARGVYELSVSNAVGESARVKLAVDDLPQILEASGTKTVTALEQLPADVWGVLNPAGELDEISFAAQAGQTIVLDLAAQSLGSKLGGHLAVLDPAGREIASASGFDGSADPLLAVTIPRSGHYRVRVSDLTLGGSTDHFYRLTVGALPYVTGIFPLSVAAHVANEVELVGYNLPAPGRVKLAPTVAGEMTVPLNADQFRSRRPFQVLVTDGPELVEREPNDTPAQAMPMSAPGAVNGRIWSSGRGTDADVFQFAAKAGQTWMLETQAAQRGSPIDTRLEVLDAAGRPVPRLILQAVRNSAVTFRGIDSNTTDCRVENWEEMELNQWLYLQGEVVRLLRAPQGPDSGFLFYAMNGKRRAYFDTSAMAHALDEPCYIVMPHAPAEKRVANGLPVFPLYYANDDDGERKLGTDSKLEFTAPADGTYLIRVTDTRGHDGDRFAYRLVVRAPQPDFWVRLNDTNPSRPPEAQRGFVSTVGAQRGLETTVPRGSGQSFSVSVDRIDGFDGEVSVSIAGLPPGFRASTPLLIQAGHTSAFGTLHVDADAPEPDATNESRSEITASATVAGRAVVMGVNTFGIIKLAPKPKLLVTLEPATSTMTNPPPAAATAPLEITIVPGQTIPARLKVERNGHDELVTFSVENLPHGVIVDNIGLNGVLLPAGENEREIFLAAARWVPEQDRLCYAIENQTGRQTSLPVLLHVRRGASAPVASAR